MTASPALSTSSPSRPVVAGKFFTRGGERWMMHGITYGPFSGADGLPSPEQAARVFERFYRADPSGTVLGTGLGLSIVHEIVQLHGGQVTLHSQPGDGTTATVRLPRHRQAAGDTAAAQPAAAEVALA